ncbi:MAG: hypothetical protein R2860_04950 [Desulfobacterales bacterium]
MEQDVNLLDHKLSDQSEEFHMLWETLKEIKAVSKVTPSMLTDRQWMDFFQIRVSQVSVLRQTEFHAAWILPLIKGHK